MRTKTILFFFLFSFCICQLTLAQDPVPEDYFDLFDPESTEDEEDLDEQPDRYKVDIIQKMLGMTGAVGDFPASGIGSYNLVNEGCDATYVCMHNTLKKVYRIYEYEQALRPKEEKLGCNREKEILQDYSLFLLTLNLDLYCIEQLHPDGNELEDVELINAMMAISDIYVRSISDGYTLIPALGEYMETRVMANPYCSEDLIAAQEIDGVLYLPCDCGDFSGTLDLAKKNKILKDIRSMLDDINPMWQMAKAIEINERLNTLPCK